MVRIRSPGYLEDAEQPDVWTQKTVLPLKFIDNGGFREDACR